MSHKSNTSFQPKEMNIVLRILIIVAASFIFALNINTFVHTGGLLPGGAAGLTLLIQEIFLKFFNIKVSYTVVNLLINAIPVYIGFKFIGKRFTALSCVVIVLSSVFTDILPSYTLTRDTLLICIFGGLINGAAVSLCLLADATSGGTDFISIFLSERRGIDSFNIILGINAVILTIAGILFSWDKALYSIIFQYVSTTIIRLLYRKYQQSTLFIVTRNPAEISNLIYELTHHGATVIEGQGSFEHDEKKIIYSVVSSPEVNKVVSAITEFEPDAFVNVLRTERLSGNFYRVPKD
ncbi:MAG: YitT family protein [Lachnospiraceae bacterium]|nr:YitT family protein [Lachnospiraceae bacterium]